MASEYYSVYRHVSMDSGKSYVGMTCIGVHNRWLHHTWLASRGSRSHFHCAIRKYGIERWTHVVVAEELTKDEAICLERSLIATESLMTNGYNMTEGGEGGRLSQEVIERRNTTQRGVKQSTQHTEAIRRSLTGKPKSPQHRIALGGPRTNTEREAISRGRRNKTVHRWRHGDIVITATAYDLARSLGKSSSGLFKIIGSDRRAYGVKWIEKVA